MTAQEGEMLWSRRDEFVRHGIPSDIYRRQIAFARRLRIRAYRRLIGMVTLAVRSALARAAH